ncbi:acetyltransferase [Fusarium acutatum]|uniref:Acetyltransferase n=1 Tax=Fusarium acutatum TaxID=78861 RepID=A0A8H4K4C4_9HYPO|nr:acetyltransferase [Fusarium acutatum]
METEQALPAHEPIGTRMVKLGKRQFLKHSHKHWNQLSSRPEAIVTYTHRLKLAPFRRRPHCIIRSLGILPLVTITGSRPFQGSSFNVATETQTLVGSMEKKKNNEFASAARDMIFSGGVFENLENDDCDGAIDDGDADEDMVNSKRNFCQMRIQKRNSEAGLLKKVIPFHWAPMLSPLTENDIDTCVTLENVALSEASRPVESGRCDGAKHVMFAHVLATLGTHPVVTDADMAMPENWRDSKASKGSPLGHQSSGRTICLHSFIVCPEVQGVGIGKTVMKSYLELMNASGMADRVAIICQPYAIQFYKCFGFKDLGPSTEALAGQGWHAMVLELRGPKRKTKEEPTRRNKEGDSPTSKAKKSPS